MKKEIVFSVCDHILKELYEEKKKNPQHPEKSIVNLDTIKQFKEFKNKNYKPITEQNWRDAITLLKIDGFIIIKNPVQSFGKLSEFKISDKGIHFHFTDTYIKRHKRWKYEKDLKAFTYYAFWLPIAISVISLSITIRDKLIINKPKPRQSEQVKIQTEIKKTSEFQGNNPVKKDTLHNQ